MVREGLRYELSSAFQKATQEAKPVVSRPCNIESGGVSYILTVTVEQITTAGPLRGLVMVVFNEVREPAQTAKLNAVGNDAGSTRVRDLTRELLQAREEVLSTREAMQISQEELKSSNEELQSTNEELQSTNEELTTAQEELQSLNEELQTVNAELQAKLDELSSASNDMRNLLNSTQIATLFLDRSLRVRFFTEHATKLIHLIPGDVGRPVTDLAFNVRYPDLAADAKEVLRTLVPIEKALTTKDGRKFALRVMPYRTMDNRIDGVVITFTDITVMTKLEAKVREQIGKKKPTA
jgi:two-component system CheB/CheR fusion protein